MTTDPPALRRTDWEPRLARRYPTRPEQAADQLATNRSEREAFGTLLNQATVRLQTGPFMWCWA